jgi:hypothetical protein
VAIAAMIALGLLFFRLGWWRHRNELVGII